MAQRFDASKLELAGEAVSIADPAGVDEFARGRLSPSDTGLLVYETDAGAGRRLVWFDRSGRALGTVGPLGSYVTLDLSSDGRRAAANRTDPQTGNMDVWLFDLARAASIRFTFHPTADGFPVWSPDGARVIFASSRGGRSGSLPERCERGS